MEDPTVPAPQSKEWFPKADWLKRHEALLAASQAVGDECKLVFLGDSITEGWGGEGKALWEEHYGRPYKALNLGIGGDEVQHVTWRVQHGEVDAINPECAVILIGTNNIGNVGHKAEPIAAGIRLLLDELRTRSCDPSQSALYMPARPSASRTRTWSVVTDAGRVVWQAARHEAAADGHVPTRCAARYGFP